MHTDQINGIRIRIEPLWTAVLATREASEFVYRGERFGIATVLAASEYLGSPGPGYYATIRRDREYLCLNLAHPERADAIAAAVKAIVALVDSPRGADGGGGGEK